MLSSSILNPLADILYSHSQVILQTAVSVENFVPTMSLTAALGLHVSVEPLSVSCILSFQTMITGYLWSVLYIILLCHDREQQSPRTNAGYMFCLFFVKEIHFNVKHFKEENKYL